MDKMYNPIWNVFISSLLFSYVTSISLLGMILFPKEVQK